MSPADPPGGAQAAILTNCRACIAYCGISVALAEDGRPVRVRGDEHHPVSRGYTCPKGRALIALHENPLRLDRPLVRGGAVSWQVALDDLAGVIGRLVAADPDSVGFYKATGTMGDASAMRSMHRLLGCLGSRQHYSSATVDIAPGFRTAELVIGYPVELSPTWVSEDPQSTLSLFVGCNPVVSHGYNTVLPDPIRRLRDFRQRGGRLWVLDPRRTETARLADRHLANRPDTDGAILAWLVRELLRSGYDADDVARTVHPADLETLRASVDRFTLPVVAEIAGVATEDLEDLLGDVRRAGRIAVSGGTGVMFGRHAMATEWMRWALLIITGSLDRPGGMWFNPGWLPQLDRRMDWKPAPPEGNLDPVPPSRPDLTGVAGQMPSAAMVDEIESGRLRALVVLGGSPLTAFPDPDRVLRALGALEALVVCDIIQTPLTRIATHVLPAAGILERADVLTNTTGQMMWAQAVVAPGAERRPVWWSLAHLARRLGHDILDGQDPDEATDESVLRTVVAGGRDGADALIEAGSRGLPTPVTYGWVRHHALPDGRFRLAPAPLVDRLPALLESVQSQRPLRLVSRREVPNSNSTPNAADPRAVVYLHPDDAAELGVMTGDTVEVESDFGALEDVTAQIDRNVRRGVVSVPHGSHRHNVGRLTSGTELDGLASQPVTSGVPVSVRRVGVAPQN